MATKASTLPWLPKDQEAAADYERYYSAADRKKMAAADFAGPHQSFPVLTQADVQNAARLIGHADDPAAVKQNVIAIAKRKGFSLPKAWQKEGAGESAAPVLIPMSASQPRLTNERIARMRVRFLADDAISLNGRQYPREAVDKLIASGQLALSNPDALPLTSFINHASADADDTTKLVGRPTAIWREGNAGYALIDIPDTHAGRDITKLAVGGYLNTISLRATGAEMKTDRNKGLPQVGGDDLQLVGIDFTTNPGLSQVARIQQVILESVERPGICEVFDLAEAPILIQEENHIMPQKKSTQVLTEDLGLPHLVDGGVSDGTDGSQTADTYQQKMYEKPPIQDTNPYGDGKPPMLEAYESAMREAHDHAAIMQGRSCAPGKESARYAAALVTEAGRMISKANDGHLDAIHDKMAHHLNMSCEGSQSKTGATGVSAAPLEPDNDMDGENAGAARITTTKENRPMTMTPAEAARLLEQAGYKIEPPKTQAQILQERMDAQAQAFTGQIAELKAFITERTQPAPATAAVEEAAPAQQQSAPQRRSLVEGANTDLAEPRQARAVQQYRNGDYLRERYAELDLARLVDRSHPLPQGIDLERLINECGQAMCLRMEEKFQAA